MIQEFFYPYLFFVLKIITVVIAITFVLAKIIKNKPYSGKNLIKNLNLEYEKKSRQLKSKILDSKEYKKELKVLRKLKSKNKSKKPKLYVLDFKGDIQASQVEALREQISLVLSVATKKDEILVRLESPGGAVSGYGLAASQFERIKDQRIKLTVAIDKVAASGGYLMACVADQILSAPFSMIGSIGVVGQVPNLHRLLKKNNVDMELHTAGDYKRTLTLFGENTDQGREKFKKDLEAIHSAFKDFVLSHRSRLDIQKIATGEIWLGQQSLDLGLVDRVVTSDVYIIEQIKVKDVFKIERQIQKNLKDRFFKSGVKAIETGVEKVVFNMSQRFF